jgi:hypothetical protein
MFLNNKKRMTSEFMASGTYGCVYYPPLPSDDLTPEDSNSVTKLTSRAEALKETEYSRLFKLVDPEGLYGLYPYKITTLSKANLSDETQLSKCKVSSLYNPLDKTFSDSAVGLLIPKGEANLLKYLATLEKSRENTLMVLEALVELSLGFLKLHQNGIYHLDVKASNIVALNQKKVLHFKLIDFGLSRTLKGLEADTASSYIPLMCDAGYIIYPFL